MRTTIHLSDELISGVMRESKSKTVTQAIRQAVEEYLKLRKRMRLIKSFGSFPEWNLDIRSMRSHRDLG